MTDQTQAAILSALRGVPDPERGSDIVTLGMVSAISVQAGAVTLALEVAPERAPRLDGLRAAAERAVAALPGVKTVRVVLTAEVAPAKPAAAPPPPRLLPEVRRVVAVASGKGGVGKSTTAVNLALALAGQGLAVGLLDADVFGPSVPRMLGLGAPPESPDGKTIVPVHAFGLTCMSIGVLVPAESAMIWRGPMVAGAIEQLLRDVAWGALDVLVIDLPPGTGDTQLTLCQRLTLDGAVIVSTPQDIALIDATRGITMFRKVGVPILGVIENMSHYVCPTCGTEAHLFGHGGARAEAERQGAPFLGEIPLDIEIREGGDLGRPIVVARPDGPHAAAYRAIAERVWQGLEGGAAG